jgi:hypothetical protein
MEQSRNCVIQTRVLRFLLRISMEGTGACLQSRHVLFNKIQDPVTLCNNVDVEEAGAHCSA